MKTILSISGLVWFGLGVKTILSYGFTLPLLAFTAVGLLPIAIFTISGLMKHFEKNADRALQRRFDVLPMENEKEFEPAKEATPGLDPATQQKLNQELLNACEELNFPNIRKAVEAGASISASRDYKTALYIICEKANRRFLSSIQNILTYFLAQGADPFQKDATNQTPFQLIVQKGLHELFSLFSEAKIKKKEGVSIVNYQSNIVSPAFQRSVTPLTSLVVNTELSLEIQKACLEALLAQGADTEVKGCIYSGMNRPTGYNYDVPQYEISTPLIGFLRALKIAIEAKKNEEAVLKPLHDMCLILLKNGANPLATTTICDQSRRNGTTFTLMIEQLPDHPLMNALVARMNEVMELRNQSTFIVGDKAAQSQEDAVLDKLVQDAITFQRLTKANAVEILATAFLACQNKKGMECLVNAVTPKTPGYAAVCRQMANQYRDSAVIAFDEATGVVINAGNIDQQYGRKRDITLLEDNPEAKANVEDYRRLFVLYCLKGAASREKDPKVQDIKNHLTWELKKHMLDWEGEAAVDGDKEEEDILDFATQRLVNETRLALLFNQKAKPVIAAPVAAKNDAAVVAQEEGPKELTLSPH